MPRRSAEVDERGRSRRLGASDRPVRRHPGAGRGTGPPRATSWSRRAGRAARSAAIPSIRKVIRARGPTATGPRRPDPPRLGGDRDPGPDALEQQRDVSWSPVTPTTRTQRPAIYKPGRAERPLWDFPDGLYRREVAAYELAEALGWELVPRRWRDRRPARRRDRCSGSSTPTSNSTTSPCSRSQRHHPALQAHGGLRRPGQQRRPQGRPLPGRRRGTMWGIDHGLCFHVQPKLRTVIWDFAGEPIDPIRISATWRLSPRRASRQPWPRCSSDDECRALPAGWGSCSDEPRLPEPRTDRPYPWPLV